MHHILRSFEQSTNWNCDNSYANITATSQALLNFNIPTAFEFQVSGATTPYTFNTLRVSTQKILNGSLTYLYTDAENLDKIVQSSTSIYLQDAAQTYKYLQPFYNHKFDDIKPTTPKSLYYGKIYFPNSNLEAMIVKRLNRYTQLTLKCLSSFKDYNILTCYWQRDTGRNSQEAIFSTNDFLCGYRCLHNFLGVPSKTNMSLYNNSSLSIGGELWLGLITLSPGCSTTLRYCTHSPNTGRPLTLTFTWNPLFGHLSSTYSAKSSSNTTFGVKYDFNLYSIESNLSFGCEFWKRSRNETNNSPSNLPANSESESVSKGESLMYHHLTAPNASHFNNLATIKTNDKQREQILSDLAATFSTSLRKMDEEKYTIQQFTKLINNSDFTSVWKFSFSLKDKNLKALWEGKFKGFLLSAGTELRKTDMASSIQDPLSQNQKLSIYPVKFGLQLQYAT